MSTFIDRVKGKDVTATVAEVVTEAVMHLYIIKVFVIVVF
jgi:hypothetical protein